MLSIIAVTVALITPALSSAVVYWDDGFEPGNTGYTIVGGMNYDTSLVHSGSRSLSETFLGDHIQGGTFTDREFPFTEELYSRFYFYLPSSFLIDAQTQTKMMFQGQNDAAPSYWWGMLFGKDNLTVQLQGTQGGNTTTNIYGNNIPRDRWVCIETHIKNNTPGVPNGIIQSWIDGNPDINLTNVNMRDNSGGKNIPTAGFTFNRLYVQYGGPGQLNYDDIAVGNTRIGCTGSGGGNVDTTPPRTPVGLTAR